MSVYNKSMPPDEIKVKGHLPTNWADWFDGLTEVSHCFYLH